MMSVPPVLYKKLKCPICGGTGKKRNPGAMLVDCNHCDKSGIIFKEIHSDNYHSEKVVNEKLTQNDDSLEKKIDLTHQTKTGRKITHVTNV